MRALRLCPVLTLLDLEYFGDLDKNSPDWPRVVRALTLFVCLFAALSFEGCSQRDRQRAKDDADRLAIVGDWDRADGTPGITRFSSDGTYWHSNKVSPDNFRNRMPNPPSYQSRVFDGKWTITNGDLVLKYQISWDGDKNPQLHVVHEKIVRLTDQELASAAYKMHDVEIKFFGTNILFRRAK